MDFFLSKRYFLPRHCFNCTVLPGLIKVGVGVERAPWLPRVGEEPGDPLLVCVHLDWTYLLISAMATLQLPTVLGTSKRFSFYFVRNTLSWPLGYNFLCLRKGVNFPFCFPSRRAVINPFVYCCLLFLSFSLWFNSFINSLLSHLLGLGRRRYKGVWLICYV